MAKRSGTSFLKSHPACATSFLKLYCVQFLLSKLFWDVYSQCTCSFLPTIVHSELKIVREFNNLKTWNFCQQLSNEKNSLMAYVMHVLSKWQFFSCVLLITYVFLRNLRKVDTSQFFKDFNNSFVHVFLNAPIIPHTNTRI